MLHFWNIAEILNVTKKRVTLISFVFPKLWTPKTWLDEWIKSPFSEELLERNMTVVPKRYWNLHHGTFIIFIDHCEVNWNWKGLFYLHANSWDCLLTHWLPMKSILLLREKIYDTNSDAITSGRKNFSQFFSVFSKSRLNLNNFETDNPHRFCISEIMYSEKVVNKNVKSPISEYPSSNNMVNLPKHCWNLHHSIFIIVIDDWQVNWVGKSFSYWHAISWSCLLTHWLPMKSILLLIQTT